MTVAIRGFVKVATEAQVQPVADVGVALVLEMPDDAVEEQVVGVVVHLQPRGAGLHGRVLGGDAAPRARGPVQPARHLLIERG